jgi:hypothetical protein
MQAGMQVVLLSEHKTFLRERTNMRGKGCREIIFNGSLLILVMAGLMSKEGKGSRIGADATLISKKPVVLESDDRLPVFTLTFATPPGTSSIGVRMHLG